MQPEQDNFDALQRLLKLKRYEQPPPRYFNEFSANVIAGIRAGGRAQGASTAGQLQGQAPWLERVLGALQAKPVYGWVFAGTLCVLVVGGVVSLEKPDSLPNVAIGGTTESLAATEISPREPFQAFVGTINNWNTNSSLMPLEGSLFDNQPRALPASGPFIPLR